MLAIIIVQQQTNSAVLVIVKLKILVESQYAQMISQKAIKQSIGLVIIMLTVVKYQIP